jgi:hypothetical protein
MSDIIKILLDAMYDNRPEEFKKWFKGWFDSRQASRLLYTETKKDEKAVLVSQCCDSPMKLMATTYEGDPCWYKCTKCNKDCNPKKVE